MFRHRNYCQQEIVERIQAACGRLENSVDFAQNMLTQYIWQHYFIGNMKNQEASNKIVISEAFISQNMHCARQIHILKLCYRLQIQWCTNQEFLKSDLKIEMIHYIQERISVVICLKTRMQTFDKWHIPKYCSGSRGECQNLLDYVVLDIW
ncbi:hypothetical protein SS50377_25148 [Spironucleus salmonicida]|uniref:Uncharacterized protein n=1 Tax=Spironucleus salmonicida TaxID=348837 RepID=V6LQ68_9EUKA|nr:hypothetical protein SS50377_25148 [Spironucleus salmonicida]|eukprot:EST46812.1 Hypothetical protein SS50377_13176 [Spironucleus salmonicida]